MLSVGLCILWAVSPKITFVRALFFSFIICDFTWQLFSITLHCIVSYLEKFQFCWLFYFIPFMPWDLSQPKLLEQFHHCYAWTILISNQENNVKINWLSRCARHHRNCIIWYYPTVLKSCLWGASERLHVFLKVTQSIKNMSPKIRCLNTDLPALKQFNPL